MSEVVALDIDDVVVKHVEGFVAWSNATYGTALTVDDYTEDWGELWGVDPRNVEARKRDFFSDEIVGNFEVVEGAPEGLLALAATKKIIGVTSRRESLRPITESVLEAIAPGAFSNVIFATYFSQGVKITRSKAEICQQIGAESLIDDHLKHCLAVNAVGIDAILFGDYAWNRPTEELPIGVVPADHWGEVLEHYGIEQPLSLPD